MSVMIFRFFSKSVIVTSISSSSCCGNKHCTVFKPSSPSASRNPSFLLMLGTGRILICGCLRRLPCIFTPLKIYTYILYAPCFQEHKALCGHEPTFLSAGVSLLSRASTQQIYHNQNRNRNT